MENKYEQVLDYEYKMTQAYIQKPEVQQWYAHAFKKFNINGVDSMKWNWSWWAFFGNVFFLLYRKAYLAAGILFALDLMVGFIPFGGLILWTLSGGYSSFYVYKAYKQKKLEIEHAIEEEDKRIHTMSLVGGSNEWAVWIGVILSVLFFAAVMFPAGLIIMAFIIAVMAK